MTHAIKGAHSYKDAKVSKKRLRKLLSDLQRKDLSWIIPLSRDIQRESDVLAIYFAEVLARIALDVSADAADFYDPRWLLIKSIAKLFSDDAESFLRAIEDRLQKLEVQFGQVSAEMLRDKDLMRVLLVPLIENVAATIEKNPQLVIILGNPELLEVAFGELGSRLAAILQVFPALSHKAAQVLPDFRETLFAALLSLNDEYRRRFYTLAENILKEIYRSYVFPRLSEFLAQDPRGKVLSPLLQGCIQVVSGEMCLHVILSIAATDRSELSIGRIIAYAIQKLGGMYVKIAQVLAEVCPPSLGRELRSAQDDAGGLFPSIEHSWQYLLEVFERPELAEWKRCLDFPATPMAHFASASIGALYELPLTDEGRKQLGVQSVLIKLQRPHLRELIAEQRHYLLSLCRHVHELLDAEQKQSASTSTLSLDTLAELRGLVRALERAIENYSTQSFSELDFTCEKRNAERVSEALGGYSGIRVPKYYYASSDLLIMERMPGVKITRMVQTRYLKRREIANNIIHAYVNLLFVHGVVWADPHPGNVLYDDVSNTIAMIDLNPCFFWDIKTRDTFKHLLYRLLLRDVTGLFQVLQELTVESSRQYLSEKLSRDFMKFFETSFSSGSLIRFVGEFLKLLSEHGIELQIAVHAALRGLSQLAVTASSVSAHNNFVRILRTNFSFTDLWKVTRQVGFRHTLRVFIGLAFDITQNLPDEDIGPSLDERDIVNIRRCLLEMRRAGACSIFLSRVDPDDHYFLRMASDHSQLLLTSYLRVVIVDRTRPASVRYVIEIPQRQWLKSRQEYIKLKSLAKNFCIIESLEQLRRHSLDLYWQAVEAWNKPEHQRTLEESRLLGEVKVSAMRLYFLRFARLWEDPYSGVSWFYRLMWRLLLRCEFFREKALHSYLSSLQKKYANVLIAHIALSSLQRIYMIFWALLLYLLRQQIKRNKYMMHFVSFSARALKQRMLFGLNRKSS